MEDVKRDWINTTGTIDDVADRCHPVYTVRKVIGDYLDPDQVHVLITVEEPRRHRRTRYHSAQSSAVFVSTETHLPEVVNGSAGQYSHRASQSSGLFRLSPSSSSQYHSSWEKRYY